jgi:hypothetical protein
VIRPEAFTWNRPPELVLVLVLELLLEELDELLEEELLELEEVVPEDELELLLELEELEPVPPEPTQLGAMKVPSCVPWKPNTLLAVWPGPGTCQPQQLVNWNDVPGVLPLGVRVTFQEPPGVIVSGKFRVSVQPLSAVVPVLVTLTSTWKNVPPV